MAKNRIDKINDQLMREISGVIRELKDSRIPLMTSVIKVNAASDLRYAKVYVSVMGDEETKKEALKGLKSAAGYIRRAVASRMEIRYTPELSFELDNSIEYGANINKILKSIAEEEKHDGQDN